jgi:hypothetical protein
MPIIAINGQQHQVIVAVAELIDALQQRAEAAEQALAAERAKRCATCNFVEWIDFDAWCGHGDESPVGQIFEPEKIGCPLWRLRTCDPEPLS